MSDERDELDRIHGPEVARLAAAGDWAGLCRYWLAHQYAPALDRSIEVTGRLGGVRGAELTRYLEAVREDPFDLHRRRPHIDPVANTFTENTTLDILLRCPFVALCQFARQFPVEEQDQILRVGMEAAQDAVQLARAAEDAALVGYFLTVLASGLSKASDPEGAVKAYREAEGIRRELARVQPDAYRPALARTLNNLGAALSELGDPEGTVKLREAEAILRVLADERPDTYRPDLAVTLTSLGGALVYLGDPEGAVKVYREAEGIRRELARVRPDGFTPDLARTLNGLGNAHIDLGDPEGAARTYREAEDLFRAQTRVWPDAYRPDLASTLLNLGAALLALGNPEGAAAALREAEGLYRALAEKRPDAYRSALARTLNNLGNALRDLGDPEGAARAYREAEDVYDEVAGRVQTAFLPERIQTAINLSSLLLTQNASRNWPDRPAAREALRKARRLTEQYRGRFKDRKQRRRVLQESMAAYRLLVEVCVDIGRTDGDATAWQEAAEVAEASRARALMELLAEQELTPANTPPGLVEEFRAFRKHLRDAILRLEMEDERQARGAEVAERPRPDRRDTLPGGDGRSGIRSPDLLADYYRTPAENRRAFLAAEVERLTAEHAAKLAEVRQHDRGFDPDVPVPPVSFPEMLALIPADRPTAVVQYTLTENRGVAIIITRDGVDAVELPGLNARRAIDLANAWYAAYRQAFASQDRMEAWAEELPRRLDPMARAAVWPVVERLRGVERLILAPAGAMHLFPLHAAVLPDGAYLADRYEVGYTPSLPVLARCRGRIRPTPTRLMSAVNPTGDLHFAEPEADIIRRHFADVVEMRRGDVSRQRVLAEAGAWDVIHYSGHSVFLSAEPLSSGLVFGNVRRPDEWLTLRDVYCGLHLQRATLVVLSGCESGMVMPDQLDEYFGLPLGFLYAGATCVLGSLWKVNDPVTMLTMGRFYAIWQRGREGMTVGAALANAQKWLRAIPSGRVLQEYVLSADFLDRLGTDLDRTRCRVWANRLAQRYPDIPPFASPVYWAPFVAYGLSYAVPARPEESS